MWDDADIEDEVKPAPAEEEAAKPADEAAADAVPEEAEATGEVTKGFEAKKLIFRHWVRPKFLQYNYLYDYQHNYYDDVINYMDVRNRGLPIDKPRAQTWAERVLRTYVAKAGGPHRPVSKDTTRLVHNISSGARFHRYHSKSLISRKYSTLGFNTVSI